VTIKLYAMAFQDRSDRVRWTLEELSCSYENIFLKKSAGEMDTPQYRTINPMGRVPTIVDGDIVLYESAAIVMYLADKYGQGKLAPKLEDEKLRAEYIKWMTWSVGSLECVIARMFTHTTTPAETATTHAFVKAQCEVMSKALMPVLTKQDYILSIGFSAADIMLASIIPGAHEFMVAGNPVMEAYMKRLMTREAAIKAKVFE
jgi:glutathione S-transferase